MQRSLLRPKQSSKKRQRRICEIKDNTYKDSQISEYQRNLRDKKNPPFREDFLFGMIRLFFDDLNQSPLPYSVVGYYVVMSIAVGK
jgi:hypothetical protein